MNKKFLQILTLAVLTTMFPSVGVKAMSEDEARVTPMYRHMNHCQQQICGHIADMIRTEFAVQHHNDAPRSEYTASLQREYSECFETCMSERLR